MLSVIWNTSKCTWKEYKRRCFWYCYYNRQHYFCYHCYSSSRNIKWDFIFFYLFIFSFLSYASYSLLFQSFICSILCFLLQFLASFYFCSYNTLLASFFNAYVLEIIHDANLLLRCTLLASLASVSASLIFRFLLFSSLYCYLKFKFVLESWQQRNGNIKNSFVIATCRMF